VAGAVLAAGIPVWVGAGSPATSEIAVELGAAVNVWDGQPATVADLARGGEVTWAGPVAGDAAHIAARLGDLARAGATWAVCAWPESLEAVAEAAAQVPAA
jgi:hypothetical protein